MEKAVIIIIISLIILAVLHTINQIFVIKNKLANIEKTNAQMLEELKKLNNKNNQ